MCLFKLQIHAILDLWLITDKIPTSRTDKTLFFHLSNSCYVDKDFPDIKNGMFSIVVFFSMMNIAQGIAVRLVKQGGKKCVSS